MYLIVRLLDYIKKIVIAVNNLGLISTLQFFFFKKRNINSIKPKNFKYKIYYRKSGDYGACSHLFTEGYRIVNNSNENLNIFDLGANIGIETIRFKFFHPHSKIIAVEPEIKNFDILKKNCEFYKDIFLENSAIGNKIGKQFIHHKNLSNKSQNSNESFYISHETNLNPINVITIPQLLQKYDLNRIDILKCDIEGYERMLFDHSCEEWLPKVNCIIFESPDSNYMSEGTTQKMYKYFNQSGLTYNTYLCGENIILINLLSSLTFKKNTYL